MLAKLYCITTSAQEAPTYIVALSLEHAAMWCTSRGIEPVAVEFCGPIQNLDMGDAGEDSDEQGEVDLLDELDELDELPSAFATLH